MNKSKIIMFILSIVCIALSAFSIIAVALCADGIKKNVFSYIVPIVFWSGLIIGHILNIICSNSVKANVKMEKPAIVSFAENKIAFGVDLLMFMSLIILIFSAYLKINNEIANLAIIAVTYLLINLHCIFNGRFMRYITER
ncbi:hypothetical protein [Agathobacter sp.]